MAEHGNAAGMAHSAEAKALRAIPDIGMQALLRSAAIGDVVSILMRAPKHKALSLEVLSVKWRKSISLGATPPALELIGP